MVTRRTGYYSETGVSITSFEVARSVAARFRSDLDNPSAHGDRHSFGPVGCT